MPVMNNYSQRSPRCCFDAFRSQTWRILPSKCPTPPHEWSRQSQLSRSGEVVLSESSWLRHSLSWKNGESVFLNHWFFEQNYVFENRFWNHWFSEQKKVFESPGTPESPRKGCVPPTNSRGNFSELTGWCVEKSWVSGKSHGLFVKYSLDSLLSENAKKFQNRTT